VGVERERGLKVEDLEVGLELEDDDEVEVGGVFVLPAQLITAGAGGV
jgi:hypothetical protein